MYAKHGTAAGRRTLFVLLAAAATLAFGPVFILRRTFKVNGPLAVNAVGAVEEPFDLSQDGSLLAYAGEVPVRGVYVQATDLSTPPVALSGELFGTDPLDDIRFTPDDSRVLYLGEFETPNRTELFSVPALGGSPPIRLNGPSGSVQSYAVTSDSSRAVYLSTSTGSGLRLYSAPTDGSQAGLQLSPAGVNVIAFELSPDGSSALFQAGTAGTTELYAVPTDGSQAATLLTPPLVAGTEIESVAPAPDFSAVAFVAAIDSPVTEAYAVAMDGSQIPARLNAPLTAGGRVRVCEVAQDSTTVVYQADGDMAGVLELYATSLDGSSAPIKVTPTPVLPGGDVKANYIITPDSAHVVYVADQEVNAQIELFVVPLDGSQAYLKLNAPLQAAGDVEDGPVSLRFQVSPDGTRVLYVADQDLDQVRELFTVPIDGSQVATRLIDPLTEDASVLDFEITSDSSWVLLRADAEEDEAAQLYRAPLDASTPAVLLNAVTAPQHGASNWRVSRDGSFVAYRGDEKSKDGFEIFGLPMGASPPGQQLSAPLECTTAGRVEEWQVTSDNQYIIYRADQEVTDKYEIFSRRLDGKGAPVRLNQSLSYPERVHVGWTVSPDGERVVYPVLSDGPYHWYSTRTDGSEAPVPLDTQEGILGQGTVYVDISPDSQWVVYRKRTNTMVNRLFSVPTDGSLPFVELSGGNPVSIFDRSVAVTADSSRVAYIGSSSTVEGEQALGATPKQLFSAPIDGSAPPSQLTDITEGDVLAIEGITPDSDWVVWFGDGEISDVHELFSVPVDGSGPSFKISGPMPSFGNVSHESSGGVQGDRPKMSPDGTWMVFRADRDIDGVLELFSARIDGSGSVIELSDLELPTDDVFHFTISPDSSQVVYTAGSALQGSSDVYVVPIDRSSPPIKLNPTLAGGVGVPLITSDGRTVVYRAEQDDNYFVELFGVPIDGSSTAVRLGDQLPPDADVWSVKLCGATNLVLYIADPDGPRELFVASAHGGPATRVNGPLVPQGSVYYFTQDFGWVPGGRVAYLTWQDGRSLFVSDLLRLIGDAGTQPTGGKRSRVLERP